DRMESLTSSSNVVDMILKITSIDCHPECLIIVFQGQYKGVCELDYFVLQSEIQRVFKVKENVCIGGYCLVEDTEGNWHRGRVLEKREGICKAFLIDTAQVLVVEEMHLASACDELFQLPPKVVLGVFASILPLGEKWSPKAINYFSSLVGLQITGHVKAVLPCQLFILEVPKIINDVLELQLGKCIDGDSFCLIVETLIAFPQVMLCKRVPQLLQQKYPVKELLTFRNSEKPTDFWSVPDGLFPYLSVGTEENVKITVALSPSKFYCQVQKWQKELEDLTGAMHLYYEAIQTENNKSFNSLGLLCAAKRQNGQWHRGVIKQLLSDCVEVWFMDFGNIEAVPYSCVQKLKAEFMALPMISFPCALSCFDSRDETVIKIQLKELTRALIGQTSVYVRVDLYNDIKRLYYITLQNQSIGTNAKHPENMNEAAASFVSLSESKITNIAVNYKPHDERYNSFRNCAGNKHTKKCLSEWDVSFEFQALLKNIARAYNGCGADEMVLKNPEPGLLCCARYSKDMNYYRAVVIEVLNVNITVYFLDFGNTDTVPYYDVKTLLPGFSDLPALAMCCTLARTFPVEHVWVKKETDFFKNIVFNRPLILHAIAQQQNKYIVNMWYNNGFGRRRMVARSMVEAGCAEYWEKIPDSVLRRQRKRQLLNPLKLKKEKVNAQSIANVCKNKVSGNGERFQKEKSLGAPSVLRDVVQSHFGKGAVPKRCTLVCEKKLFYKEFVFEPGAIFEVVCSYFASPADFSCQLQSKLPELNKLMEQIQTYYEAHVSPYESGQVACIVKRPKDGKWYRAAVMRQVPPNKVDVVFVDYGYRDRVVLEDLQGILPDFLALESQAFRCALKNVPLQIDSFNWSEEVHRHFEDFISASRGPLTCIIYALVLVRPKSLYNIVDLQTPFTSAEELLREHNLNHSEYVCLRNFASVGSLYSFWYSSFNIKVGSEEDVYITHICSPSEFYCQLNRNTETLEALRKKISVISKLSNNGKYDTSSTRLFIAKYFRDGLFYRALASESASCLYANFVDFGNKTLVERDQLMPIPNSATDLIFTPMQAIKCCLSDFRETKITVRVTRWFEETFLGKLLKAVIVSRESDGPIVVELYDGQRKVSQEIKEKVLEELTLQDSEELDFRNTVAVQWHKDQSLTGEPVSPSLCHPALNSKEVTVSALSEPHNGSLNYTGQQKRRNEKIPKSISLPQRDIWVNSEVAGYISHINSLSSFCIQLAEDENLITQLAEQLNESMVNIGNDICLDELMVGDLAVAEHDADCFYYRAVVKTLKLGSSFEVEFIDYGDAAVVSSSKIYQIQKKFLTLPRLSVHCFLSRGKSVPDENWTEKSTSYFVSNINNRPVACKFLQQHGEQWEIDVICDGESMSNDLLQRKVRTGWQNTPKHYQGDRPKQILVTNGTPQDRRSKNYLGGQKNGEFHVQLLRKLQILHVLNVMLVREAQGSHLLGVNDIEEGLECVVKSERSLKWYRSKVIKKFGRENDKIKSIPEQAVLCKWIRFKKLKKIQFVHVVNALLNHEIRILFLRYVESSHIWEIDIIVGGILFQECLNQLLSHCQTIVGPEKSNNTHCKEFDISLKINPITWSLLWTSCRRYPGFATAVTDPSNFCIQFEVLFDCMKNLSLLFSDLPDDLPALPEEFVAPGARCLIKFGLEAQWNRAVISEVTSQSVVLTFIDYGFLKSIPYSDIHRLKVISESLSYLPCLAHSCSLHDTIPANGEYWSDEAKLLFQMLLSKPGLIFHLEHYGFDLKLEVDVLYEDKSLSHASIAVGHAV
ncbi:Tudor domain-containing protein 15, partial [Cuculus canorus]